MTQKGYGRDSGRDSGRGYGCAFGGGTIVNAVAAWKGCAFAVELKTYAEVRLDEALGSFSKNDSEISVRGKNYENPGMDSRLIELCVRYVLEQFDCRQNASVLTKSNIPSAGGLKSSSAAANASVLAALDAVGGELTPVEAVQLGVRAAREAGVTITGAYDDACASFFGGVAVTDNREMKLLNREEFNYDVLILNPGTKVYSAQTNVARSLLIKDLAEIAFEAAKAGEYKKAMKLNGLLYCGVLGFDPEPAVSCMEIGKEYGAVCGLSGTGPSFTALLPSGGALTDFEKTELNLLKKKITDNWRKQYPNGLVFETKTCNRSALSESRRFSAFMKAEKKDLAHFDECFDICLCGDE
ncbi:MAG: shikimate kinase [Methanimicrococcus sp.]|nr:shikimate kinase [Methanimicrococcus sp.]